MTKKSQEGISLSHYLTRPKWERELNEQNPLHSQSVMDGRLFEELKKGTLPQPLHEAFLDEIQKAMENDRKAKITSGKGQKRDPKLARILGVVARTEGKAKELWPKLFGMMEEEELEPEDEGLSYSYIPEKERTSDKPKRKTITLKNFQNVLSEIRATKKNPNNAASGKTPRF